MSTRGLDTHDEPWLREALDGLLTGEPPLLPAAFVEDARRGRVAHAVIRRRRTATRAVAAALVMVAVPLAILLRPTTDVGVPPASSLSPAVRTTPTKSPDGYSPAPTDSAPAAASASAAAAASARAVAARDAALALRHPCRVADLAVTLAGSDGATGTTLLYVWFTNRSATACGLNGHPAIGVSGAGAAPFTVRYAGAGAPVVPTPVSGPVLLPTGRAATLLLSKYRCDVGEAGSAGTLVARLPGDVTPVVLPLPRLPVCVGGAAAAGNTLSVSPFYVPTG